MIRDMVERATELGTSTLTGAATETNGALSPTTLKNKNDEITNAMFQFHKQDANFDVQKADLIRIADCLYLTFLNLKVAGFESSGETTLATMKSTMNSAATTAKGADATVQRNAAASDSETWTL